ncbi:hypothetical protein EVAR_35456_1 [Eumeta japonica]|uniref:Uncharacterized protein n=1 Tax=Eumeta variegata TaxID=151549 RepID=A0A4C1XPK6_EUMVA|nr:hypothetical protein EVAR_35456_1 [Eumeta japonica]
MIPKHIKFGNNNNLLYESIEPYRRRHTTSASIVQKVSPADREHLQVQRPAPRTVSYGFSVNRLGAICAGRGAAARPAHAAARHSRRTHGRGGTRTRRRAKSRQIARLRIIELHKLFTTNIKLYRQWRMLVILFCDSTAGTM